MDWAGGYVADIGYTAGFYRETTPAHLAFAALLVGRSPGRAMRPRRVLELGFGQGFGLALLAAANPHIRFEGIDFNPEHVGHARRLIEAARLENVTVEEAGFEEAAGRAGDNDLDLVALHGIFSWVSRQAQDAIVQIARQRLQPDGLLYVSYNCMPGWAPLAPIRQLMLQVKRRHANSSERQLAAALEVLTRLREGGAAYFAGNPQAAQHAQAMLGLDRVYLAHEYLDEHWDLFSFADLAARMSEAKLSYLASATLLENIDAYSVPPALQPSVAAADDTVMRETLRDFAANKRFRRDVFARGTGATTSGEHRRLLSGLSFALAVPREKVSLTFAGPLEQLTGREDLNRPVLDLLGRKNAGFDELAIVFPASGPNKIALLLDCLALLVASGQVLPILESEPVDPEPARRFNRAVVAAARTGRFYGSLAAPVAGTGIPVTDIDLLALSALQDGVAEEAAPMARHARALLLDTGRHPLKEGRLLEDEAEALGFLEERFAPVLAAGLPVWRKLGALA